MQENLVKIMERVFLAFAEEYSLPTKVCKDFGFHMADWLDDDEKSGKVFDISQPLSNEQVCQIVAQFLIPAANPVAAAKKLAGYGPMEDIFGVGIFEEDEIEEIPYEED